MIEKLPTPKELVEKLDETVIGQERAKIALSVAVINHYSRLGEKDFEGGNLLKSNMLFIGPTGSGKTLLIQTMAKLLDIPFITVDVTGYTPAGFKGQDLEEFLKRLYGEAGEDVERAEQGIIFLDEFDKLAAPKSVGPTQEYNIGIQQGYLKMLEGLEVTMESGRSRRKIADFGSVTVQQKLQPDKINTSRILFICGGAFTGLDRIIDRRLNGRHATGTDSELNSMARFLGRPVKEEEQKDFLVAGFNRALEDRGPEKGFEVEEADRVGDLLRKVTTEDLIQFGFIPEILGRIPFRVTLEDLDEDALVRILIEPKDAVVKQFRQRFLRTGCDLYLTSGALRTIAREALENNTGARGLAGILEDLLLMSQFRALSENHSGDVLLVDEGAARGEYEPRFVKCPRDFSKERCTKAV